MAYQYLNLPGDTPPPLSQLPPGFSLRAAPGTDIWRKPSGRIDFSAPLCYCSFPTSAFRRARATVSAAWRTQYDQGGLCLVLSPPTSGPEPIGAAKAWRWIKAGVELFNGRPSESIVSCDRAADWSMAPLATSGDGGALTIEMEREERAGQLTSTLWVYVIEGETRRPVREVTWAFADVEEECWVGVYAAKPKPDQDGAERELVVQFDGVQIDAAEC